MVLSRPVTERFIAGPVGVFCFWPAGVALSAFFAGLGFLAGGMSGQLLPRTKPGSDLGRAGQCSQLRVSLRVRKGGKEKHEGRSSVWKLPVGWSWRGTAINRKRGRSGGREPAGSSETPEMPASVNGVRLLDASAAAAPRSIRVASLFEQKKKKKRGKPVSQLSPYTLIVWSDSAKLSEYCALRGVLAAAFPP